MSKKTFKKTNVLRFAINIIISIIGIISLIVCVVGAIGLSNVGLIYEKEKLECDGKDYSSYVKVNRTETPGNEKINYEIEITEKAMNNARAAGDYNAFGQLNEKYQELLYMQSQTSTTNESYDYSGVEEAKKNCRSIANTHKKEEETKNIWLIGCGAVVLILCLGALAVYNIIVSSRKH